MSKPTTWVQVSPFTATLYGRIYDRRTVTWIGGHKWVRYWKRVR